jgi:hypothetical protein
MNTLVIIKAFILGLCLTVIAYRISESLLRAERIESKVDHLIYLLESSELEDEVDIEPLEIDRNQLPVFKLPVE